MVIGAPYLKHVSLSLGCYSRHGNTTAVLGLVAVGNADRDDDSRLSLLGGLAVGAAEVDEVLEGGPGHSVLERDQVGLRVGSSLGEDTDALVLGKS